MKRNSLKTDAGEMIACVSCLAQNRQADAFCHECGAPIGTTANLDPLKNIQTQGFLLRKALEGRPKPIVLLGIWILHLPVLAVSVGVAIYMILNLRGLSEYIFFLAALGLSYFAFVVLYRVTRNYLTIPKKR